MYNSGGQKKLLISVVSPVYGCKTYLRELCSRISATLEKITSDFEILLVDDASPDQPWELITDMNSSDSRIKGIQLSRNFGQHYAIAAGLEHTSGEWVVVMDCDLQDKPEEISRLYQKAKEGYDIVIGRRIKRKDNFSKKLFSRLYSKLLSYMTNTKLDSTTGNYGIYSKKAVQAVNSMQDNLRYFPAMIQWVGFKQTAIDVEHTNRKLGKTSYTFKKLVNLSMNVIVGFSNKPLRLTVKLGLFISFFAFLYALYNLFRYFSGGIDISGWTSLITSVWLLSGIIIALIGMLGLYIGKIFENVKNRPKFIVSKTLNLENVQDK